MHAQASNAPVTSGPSATAPAPPPSTTPQESAPVTSPELMPAPATSQDQDTSQPSGPAITGMIAKITISGNKHISTDAILGVLSQKVGADYSQSAAEADRDAIKDMGYFNGPIDLSATQDPAGGVDVNYTVVENYVVTKIVFTANTSNGQPTIPADKLKSLMNTKEGQVLNANTLQRDLDRLFDRQTGYASEQGYIIDPSDDINIDPDTGILTIPLIEAHIDHIVITGNKRTKNVVITRELRSKPGDVLNETLLQKDLTRVYNLGLFDEVGPWKPVPTDIGKVDVDIPVVEKKSGTVQVGVGYSSREKLVGTAELAENNFRGLGERVAVTWEVDAVDAGTSVDLTYFEPYLDKRHTSMSVDLFDKAIYRFSSDTFGGSVGSNDTYIEQHKGVTVDFDRPLSDTLSAGINVRTETVHINNVQLPPQDLFIRQQGPVSSIGIHATRNTRDNDFSPASGGLRSVSLEVGTSNTTTDDNTPGPLVPGLHNFGKVGVDLRQYISLQGPRKAGDFNQPKKVFAIHLLFGATNKEVPFYEQYFLGGADNLRSLLTDRYWGTSLALFQAELRIPFGKDNNIQGVLFTDAGDAWGSIYQDPQLEQHVGFTLSSDVGLGVRLVTPIGPIRLDYGIGSGGGRTQFSIGQTF